MASLAQVLRQVGYVTPQGQVTGPNAPLAQQLKNYVTNVIPTAAQNLAQQRADIDAALTMGDQGIQVGDRAAFERQIAQVPNLMGLTAYHGTPHTIKGKFDISKVGTGEGNQSYGHGIYFAENPKVAEGYKQALSTYKTTIDGMPLTPDNPKFSAAMSISSQGYDKALKTIQDAKKAGFIKPEVADKDIADIISLKNAKIKSVQEGNLYKVDIPDEYIPNMLDWDKPLNQQSELVQTVAKDLLPKIKQVSPWIDLEKATGGDFYRAYQRYRGNYPDFASEGLNEAGIKGIRYLDEGSREAGKGTSNFVVFEPSDVKILEQNSKPLSRKEILEQELKKVVE